MPLFTEGEGVLATVLDQLPLAVLVVAASGRILIANRPARGLLGDLAVVPLPCGGSEAIKFEGAGGRRLWLTASPLPADRGRTEAVVAVLRTHEEHEAATTEARRRQTQRLESIGLLAGGIAHDFNNLLTGILGNATLIEDQVPPPARPNVQAIIQAGQKGAELTRQLLVYAGKSGVLVEDVNISEVVRHARVLLRLSIPRNIDLRWRLAVDLPAVAADPSQIEQILMNLATNAAEAVGECNNGNVTIATRAVEIGTRCGPQGLPTGPCVALEVTDSGCGMDETTRARVFEPFFSTKAAGRGLGLAAVHGIVRAHRGMIEVESRVGQGTVFRVFLPATARRAEVAPARRTRPARMPRGSATVLVADDEPLVRSFVKAALAVYGYKVLEAANGAEALAKLADSPEVQLVILDVVMPVLGGNGTLAEIRRYAPTLQVLIMSGYNQEEALRLCAADERTAFIQKPYTTVQLAERVQAALEPSAVNGTLRAAASV